MSAAKPTVVEVETDGSVTTIKQVDVAIETDKIDQIEIAIGGLKFHFPARMEDWPADATDLFRDDQYNRAVQELLPPAELARFKKLRLTNGQVGSVLVALFSASGLGSTGE